MNIERFDELYDAAFQDVLDDPDNIDIPDDEIVAFATEAVKERLGLIDTGPGAGAPGPRQGAMGAVQGEALDGTSTRRLAAAAIASGMSDRELWAAVEAADEVALMALEARNYAVGARAVERQEVLGRELRRRYGGKA